MNGGKEEEEEGSDPMARGQYPTGQLCQVSHLELRGEMQMVQGPAGGERPGFGFSGSMNTQRYTSYHRRKQ